MAVKGDLSEFHPVEVLQLIRENRGTGILLISYPEGYMGMYFVDGNIAFAFKSKRMYDLYTKRRVKEFVNALKNRDKEAFAKLMGLVKSTLAEFFSTREGSFTFEEVNFFVDSDVKEFLIGTERVIFSESKKIDDESIINKKISSLDMKFQKTKECPNIVSRLQLDEEDFQILDAINGNRTVKELIEFTGLPASKVKQTLYGFLCAGMIKRAPKKFTFTSSIFSLNLIKKLINRIRGL